MVETLLKAAIIVVILVGLFLLVTWALSFVGVTIPSFVIGFLIALCILAGALWLWRQRGSLGL